MRPVIQDQDTLDPADARYQCVLLELVIPAEDEKLAIETAEAYAERVGWPSVGVYDIAPAWWDEVTNLPAWTVRLERE